MLDTAASVVLGGDAGDIPLLDLGHDGHAAKRNGAHSPGASGNGYRDMTADGDYEIRDRGERLPPAPWSNVIANPRGGFLVTERGAGFTWAGNSYFYRLTPWHNDPVSDPPGEAIYLRDEESGRAVVRRPRPAVRRGGAYTVRHGAGASTFEHQRRRDRDRH